MNFCDNQEVNPPVNVKQESIPTADGKAASGALCFGVGPILAVFFLHFSPSPAFAAPEG